MTGEQVVRRLAAILAADVVAYSRLMGRDENGTLARLREHRKQRFEPTLARHGGRLVKLTGDGALVEFPSAVDALSAAIEFQQAMAEANKDQPAETAIDFRIGLHLGDLIVDGDDLYGDGVNVAARLEAEAPPGGIVVSRAIHHQRHVRCRRHPCIGSRAIVESATSSGLTRMTEQRRLAAILVADVVGYSKLVGADETGTLAKLQRPVNVS